MTAELYFVLDYTLRSHSILIPIIALIGLTGTAYILICIINQ